MYDNKKKKNLFYIIIGCCLCICGCCTNSNRIASADDADIIAGNSRAAGQLEATIAALDGTVNSSRERIADIIETGRSITDGLDRLEYLFGQYESEVGRLLGEIDRIRSEIEIQSKSNNGGGNNSGVIRGDPDSTADP